MSTRAIIARADADYAKTGHFKGVYVHEDGYPHGVGKWLWTAIQGVQTKNYDGRMAYQILAVRFKNDLPGLLKFLLNEHPLGWVNIYAWNECVCGKPVRPADYTFGADYWDYCLCIRKLECFCHEHSPYGLGMQHLDPERAWRTHEDVPNSDCRWLYVIDERTGDMDIFYMRPVGGRGLWATKKEFIVKVNLFDRNQNADWEAWEKRIIDRENSSI